MTAEAKTDVSADLMGVPSLTLDQAQLGDVELLLSGVFAPLTGFMGAADVAAVIERGTLADGTPWPVPVVLDVREDALPGDAHRAVLADPEGTPLALLDIAERGEVPPRPGRGRGPGDGPAGGPSDRPARARARPVPTAHDRAGRGAGGVRRRTGAGLRHPRPGAQPADRPAPAHGRAAQGAPAAAAAHRGPGRRRDQARRADPRRAGRGGQPSGRHHGHPGAAGLRGAPSPASAPNGRWRRGPWSPPRTERRT